MIRAAGQYEAVLSDGDALIFMNFRADRARQITRAFVNADFNGFTRKKVVKLGEFVMLSEYAADIKAAHGNAEQMRDPTTGQAHTAHTNLPVPLIYIGPHAVQAVEGGKLSDIAPTLLTLMGETVPQEMTGKPLFIVK